jgi:hypothetical protein
MQNHKLLEEHQPGRKLLFLAAPNVTLIPMFWTFGLHGSDMFRQLDVAFAVPRILLMIPLLRDMLLMAGAVEDDFATVKYLLSKGRAVCICPNGVLGSLRHQTPEQSVTRGLSPELAQECLRQSVSVVPVVFAGETARYRQMHPLPPPIVKLQRYCAKRWKLPFPLLFHLDRERDVTAMISAPITPRAYAAESDHHAFARAVHDAWRNLGTTPEHLFLVEEQQV